MRSTAYLKAIMEAYWKTFTVVTKLHFHRGTIKRNSFCKTVCLSFKTSAITQDNNYIFLIPSKVNPLIIFEHTKSQDCSSYKFMRYSAYKCMNESGVMTM